MNGQRPQGDPKPDFWVMKHMDMDSIGYHRVVHGHWGWARALTMLRFYTAFHRPIGILRQN
jgi:hypothetical protein